MTEMSSANDQESYQQWVDLIKRIGERWPDGTGDAVRKHKLELWERLDVLESRANSLIKIKDKPKELKKKFKEVLNEYEHTANCCITVAQRLSRSQAA